MRLDKKKYEVILDDGSKTDMIINVPVRERSKVYIIGCAGTKDLVPWGDPDAEYWGVNNLFGVPMNGATWTRWFEIHNIWFDAHFNCMLRRGHRDFRGQPIMDYMKGLAAIGIPVYMQKHWVDLVPNSVPFPLIDMVNWFQREKGLSITQSRYITNTISYQIALAIMEGFKEMHIYGVDMSQGTGKKGEYSFQRPSCELWAGIAIGLGIKVVIPDEADLLKSRFMYAFEESTQIAYESKMKKIRLDMVRKRDSVASQIKSSEAQMHQYTGAIHAIEEMQNVWSNCADELVVK